MSIKHGLLALLGEGPRYGFQLKKEFEELTGLFWPLNVGQVYTTLGRLVRDGLIAEELSPTTDGLEVTAAGKDSQSSVGSDDSQRSYRLTERGRDEVRAWFATPRPATTPERDELTIKVALAVATNRPDVTDMIQGQRNEATSAIQALTRRKARLEPTDLSQAVVLDAAIARLDAELRWLDLTSARLAGASRGRAALNARDSGRPGSGNR